jgi:hypothetical protein
MYKVSFDKKTIETVPENAPLFDYIKGRIPGAKSVITDTFTSYDLKCGDTKELTVSAGRKSYSVLAGKNLTPADLKAKYDNSGSKKK